MAPTTLPGQRATTCMKGRDVSLAGYPLRVSELLSTLRTPAFIARGAVHTPRRALEAKALLRRAFQNQVEGRCFSLVELLSTCPTNWGLPPREATQWLERNMVPYYPWASSRPPKEPDRAPAPLGPRPLP
jgi:2-oxoglutarate ferredoxin oxidoreductase subunit beta